MIQKDNITISQTYLLLLILLISCLHYTTFIVAEEHPVCKPPIITQCTLNPTKVQPGDIMTVSVSVIDKTGIEKVEAKFFHEKGFDKIFLKRVLGSQYDGIWQGTWIVHDTLIKEYNTITTVYSKSGQNSFINHTWYDPIDSWWNSDWNLKKNHTITGSIDGSQENYNIKIVAHKSTGTDDSENVYLGNSVRNDFGDVRFINSSGVELNYTLDFFNSGTNATFWVKIPSIPISPNTVNISVYYHNPNATSNSNIKNTFIQSIDFTSDTINTYGGSQDEGGDGEWSTDTDENYIRFGLGTNTANNWKAVDVGNLNIVGGNYMICLWYKSDSGECEISGIGHDTETGSIEQSKTYQIEGTQNWGITDITQYNRNTGGWQYLEGVLDDYTGNHNYITIVHDNDGSTNTDDFFKNIRVRKYTANEPTHGTWGSEEVVTPTKPILILPTNNSSTNDNTTSIQWTASQNADNYTLLVDNETDFTDGDESINVSLSSSTTSYTIPEGNALSEGKWYWKVVANNSQGSNSSDVWNFIVDWTSPDEPTLSLPLNNNNTSSNSVVFSWNETNDSAVNTSVISNISHYELQIDNDSDFSSLLVRENTTDSSTFSLTETVSGQLFWRVRAWDNAGNSGNFSEVRNLTVFNFLISSSSGSLTILKGYSQTVTIDISPSYGIAENITLSYEWDTSPSDVNISFNLTKSNTSSWSSTMTIQIGADAPTETYICSVIGTSDCGIEKSVDITIDINSMTFLIFVDSSSLVLNRNDSASTLLSVEFLSGSKEPVTLSGNWHGTAPAGISHTINPNYDTPSYDTTLELETGKSASAGTYIYRITGTGGGMTRTVDVGVSVRKNLTITLNTDNNSYEKGQEIQFSGTAKNPDGNSVTRGTATIQLSMNNWSHTLSATISGGTYSAGYYITFDKPDGDWTVSVSAIDIHGHETTSSISSIITIENPGIYEHYYISVSNPITGEVFKRGNTITFSIILENENNEKIQGAEVIGYFSSGEKLVFSENILGVYSASYELSYNSPKGECSLYIEGKKQDDEKLRVGFNFLNYVVNPVEIKLDLIKPKSNSMFEVGENIKIILEARYPDDSSVENGVISSYGPDGSKLVFLKSDQSGQYIASYYPSEKDLGDWKFNIGIEDVYGNYGVLDGSEGGVKIVESKILTILLRYWWITAIACIILLSLFGNYLHGELRKNNLVKIKNEIVNFENLKKNNAILYFSDGKITRNTYDQLLKEYESKIAVLSRKKRVLEKKIANKKMKKNEDEK